MKKPQSWLQKYRNIIISIGLFLVLDASVLIMNFFISFQISQDAIEVNLSGRQRMLSQRMTKALLDIERASKNNNESRIDNAINELTDTRNLFDDTLTSFEKGGVVKGADGTAVSIKAVNSDAAIESINDAKKHWQPYVTLIDAFLGDVQQSNQVNADSLTSLINYALDHNIPLLKSMNDLTVELESVADSKATILRIIQTVGILLALLNFFLIMFHFMRQLRESDERIASAQRETSDILQTVGSGLFLLDSNLEIGSQHSKELTHIFKRDDFSGKKLSDILSGMVSPDDLKNTNDFIAQLYNPRVNERLINDLNPLQNLHVNMNDAQGSQPRYLDFRFSRVVEDKQISRILVNVNDVTRAIELEQKLQQEKAQTNEQIQMISTILNTDARIMSDFIRHTRKRLIKINNTLKNPRATSAVLSEKLRTIFREVHSLKGEASAIDMGAITNMATDFEADIKQLQGRPQIEGDDFLSLIVHLDNILNIIDSVDELNQRIQGNPVVQKATSVSGNTPPEASNMHDNDSHHIQTKPQEDPSKHFFQKYVASLAQRNQKQAQLQPSGLACLRDNPSLHTEIHDIVIQLLGNALVHGIETPSERLSAGKPAQGTIWLNFKDTPDALYIVVKDDGSGINYDTIRQKAVRTAGLSQYQASALTQNQLISLMFSHGFSTQDNATEDAGQGVGLDIIRDLLKTLQGKIKVNTKQGEFTQFSVALPKQRQA